MLHPLVGVLLVSYLLGVYLSMYVAFNVREPLRRALYLLMIFLLMLVGSVVSRLYMFTHSGYTVEVKRVGAEYAITLRHVYVDEPYAPSVSLLLTGLSLIPVFLSIVPAVELMVRRRGWHR